MTHFGTTQDGREVEALTLTDGRLTVTVLTFGARLQDVRLAGVDHALTLGSDRVEDYEGVMRYFGALVGPVANRIGTGRVTIDGMTHEMERNQDGRISLHSGSDGLHARIWDVTDRAPGRVVLTCTLDDGACGLPGTRRIDATFEVSDGALHLDVHATSDETTPMNIANHSLWNLDGSATWVGHSLQISAERYLPTDGDDLVTGDIVAVADTDMDFRTARAPIPGSPQLDHNFCLSDTATDRPRDVATLRGARGVEMTIATDRPGLQVFDNQRGLRPGAVPYEGLAMEPQDWPDAPAHRAFPDILIGPDRSYRQTSRWTFRQT